MFMCILSHSTASGEAEVSERTLLADLMFACQGIDGRYIQFSASADAYRLNYKVLHSRPDLGSNT